TSEPARMPSWFRTVSSPNETSTKAELSHRLRLRKRGRATCRETCTCGSGRVPRCRVSRLPTTEEPPPPDQALALSPLPEEGLRRITFACSCTTLQAIITCSSCVKVAPTAHRISKIPSTIAWLITEDLTLKQIIAMFLGITISNFLSNFTSSSKVFAISTWLLKKFLRFKTPYGVSNLRNFLRNHVEMAKIFEELVKLDKRFEIVVPKNLAM
ncbi:hypothetical protein S245_012059, partial [Arachis hypogaea]